MSANTVVQDTPVEPLPLWKRRLLEQVDLLIAEQTRCTIVLIKDGPAILVMPAKTLSRIVMVE